MTVPESVTKYDVGDLVVLTATFLASDLATPADPGSVYCLVAAPNGSVATYLYGEAGASVTKVATGAYRKDVAASMVGEWFYRWQATGAGQAAEEHRFIVERTFVL